MSECSRCSTAAHECFVARLAGSLDRGGEGRRVRQGDEETEEGTQRKARESGK